MDTDKELLVILDNETNKDLIEKFGSNKLKFDSKEKRKRFEILLAKYEDNNLSIAFIGIKLKKLLITNERYQLETKRHHLNDSNSRILVSMEKLI